MNKEDLKVIEGGALDHEVAMDKLDAELQNEEAETELSQAEIDNFYEQNKELVDMVGGLEIFETILTLPEDQFTTLAPNFYQMFEEVMNESRTRSEIAMILTTQPTMAAEIEKEVQTSYLLIDEMEDVSQQKKDFLKRILALMANTVQEINGLRTIEIPCELSKGVKVPTYAHDTDAGLDIYAQEEYTIAPGETKIIPTGIKVAIPEGYAILIQPRSGQSAKTKLRIANTPGLIDAGYRDEIGVIVENIEPPFKDIDYEFDENGEIHIKSILHGEAYTISEGQRFAQMRLVQVPRMNFVPMESVGEIGVNRNGGFGSSGK